jgi:hypothetical protein
VSDFLVWSFNIHRGRQLKMSSDISRLAIGTLSFVPVSALRVSLISMHTPEPAGRNVRVRNMLLHALLRLCAADGRDDKQWEVLYNETVTWLLQFIRFAAHPSTVVLSLKILGHLVLTRPAFAARFRTVGGWRMLEMALLRYHHVPDVHAVLLALLLDKPMLSVTDAPRLDLAALAIEFKVPTPPPSLCLHGPQA